MAQPLLGLRSFGSAGTSPAVFQVLGTGQIQIGDTFATQLYTVVSGTFVVGDVLTMSGGTNPGAQATVTQVLTSPTRLILRAMQSTWELATGTMTGGTSGATGTKGVFEGVEQNAGANTTHATGRCIEFENKIYAFHYSTVYTYNATSTYWEEAYRVLNPAVSANAANFKIGLEIVTINDATTLVGAYEMQGGTTWRSIKTTNGTSWTEAVFHTGIMSSSNFKTFAKFRNSIYIIDGNQARCMVWNPVSDTSAVITFNSLVFSNGGKNHHIVVCENRLFVASFPNPGFNFRVLELSFGLFTVLADFGGSIAAVQDPSSSQAIGFTGPDGFLYWIFPASTGGSSNGFKCYKLDTSTNTVTDISASVIPPALALSANLNINGGYRLSVYVDCETNAVSGGPPIVFLWVASSDQPGTTRTCLQWNGPSSLMTVVDSGGDEAVGLPETRTGSGDRVYFLGQPSAKITAKTNMTFGGGVRLSFILYPKTGGPSLSPVSVKIKYSTKGTASNVNATLSNPSAGSISGGNTITGLTADGTTVYQVDCPLITSDGLLNGTYVDLKPLVYS